MPLDLKIFLFKKFYVDDAGSDVIYASSSVVEASSGPHTWGGARQDEACAPWKYPRRVPSMCTFPGFCPIAIKPGMVIREPY